jgi:uncharacterized protein
MFLKLLLLAIVGFLIYRFFGGKLPQFGRSAHQKKLDEDTLIECKKCNTYVTVKESLIIDGEYYCSIECKQ